tara:strand:+ start:921 stop:1160 length:240 start_codon:yes stop_codon:yes gene_type:complete
MTSNNISNIEKHSEINYLIDSENFISENKHIDFSKFNKNSIILFEYTSDFYKLIKYLNNNKIKYTKLSDDFDLEFIIIE